ncbi:hypothetical protein GP2143_02189 [marine gamma proteobacterium HTCC2143]|uniref:Uncharacterized protein n=1 Tax=marine gamma proteobacterium HTCC2143 TaxID=247633 RepID=A0YE59_9GAMM|nr:hypothetical protein GP2143_02189 [marine gamma proteobacterium HTCC2143]
MPGVMARIQELIDDQRKTLKLFALGALLFFIGLGGIQWSGYNVEPSLQQEYYVLAGGILASCGFLVSITAQILLIVHRFQRLGKPK